MHAERRGYQFARASRHLAPKYYLSVVANLLDQPPCDRLWSYLCRLVLLADLPTHPLDRVRHGLPQYQDCYLPI
jgi:hypothetical protein